MSYLDIVETHLETLKNSIIIENDKRLDRFDIQKLTGDDLSFFGKLQGVYRRKVSPTSTLTKIVRIDFGEIVNNVLVPSGTRFYLDNSIFLITQSDFTVYNSDFIELDAVLGVKVSQDLIYPIVTIGRIESSNSNIGDYSTATTREISFLNSDETDDQYRQRILDFTTGKNIDGEKRIRYIMSSINVTDYVIVDSPHIVSGSCEIVMSPPELEMWDKYAKAFKNIAKVMFNTRSLSFHLKKPLVRILTLKSFEKMPEEIIDYVSSLPMGRAPLIGKIKELCGNNTVMFLDGFVTTTITLKYFEKVQLLIQF